MTAIERQLAETWQIHNKTCLLLIENITDEALSTTLNTRGGRTVGRQLAHMYNVHLMIQRRIRMRCSHFDKEADPSREELKQAFTASGDVVAKLIARGIANDGKIPRMKSGIAPLPGYLISHEAQHRAIFSLHSSNAATRSATP